MKLQPDEIERIVGRLLAEWKANHLVTFKAQEYDVRNRLIDIFTKELLIEDNLNKDVDVMLAKYEKEFQSGALDRRKMFQMVKNQLIKERKIVL